MPLLNPLHYPQLALRRLSTRVGRDAPDGGVAMVLALPRLASVAVATARQEPIFYITDDPEIRRALGVPVQY